MTYGQLRLQITQENPGIPLELVDGWIQDRYTEILDRIEWKRMEGESVLQVPASYQVGTIAATQGSTAIVGTGTTWTAAMNGRMVRLDDQSEYYQFTFVDATHGTLDRGWEHPDTTLSTYRIDQNIFLLPADARVVNGVRSLHDWELPLERVTPGELDRKAGQRREYGTPVRYAHTFDNFSSPPVMQIEFSPVPESPNSVSETLSFVVDYTFDASAIAPNSTGTSLLPWVRPAALKAGVKSSMLRNAKDWTGATAMQAEMDRLVNIMAKVNAAQVGPQQIRTAPEYGRRSSVGSSWPINRRWDGE